MWRAGKALGETSPALVLILAVLLAWQFGQPLIGVPTYILPTPSIILGALVKGMPRLGTHLVVTLKEIVLGFVIGDVIGIALALAIHKVRFLERSLYPLIVFFQNVPKIAIAPIFVLWFGYGMSPKIVVVVVISFFPVVVNTLYGLRAVDPNLLDLVHSVSGTPLQLLTKVELPNSLPYMFEGFKIAITFSVIGAIVGEWVGSDNGLGFLILLSSAQLETDRLFAAITVVSLVGVALFYLIGLAERLLLPWEKAGQRASQSI